MRGAIDIHRRLLAADVAHEVLHLGRRVMAADDLPEALGVAPQHCAVVHLVIADGTTPVAVALPAGRGWAPTVLAAALDARAIRSAQPGETSAATEYTHGLVSPLALPPGLELLVDASLAGAEDVYTATGETATAVRIRGRDLVMATGARVCALASTSLPARSQAVSGSHRFAPSTA